jgi:DNA-binding transcriptional LysR family regulator
MWGIAGVRSTAMDIDSLKLLLAVAERGSFSKAARDRDLDPSAVSRTIAAVERELGARLFQRTTRAMSLTPAGELYLSRVQAALDVLDTASEALREGTSQPEGLVRITASVAFGTKTLVPLLPAFRAAYPRITLELLLSDANLELVEDRIDIAVRLGPSYRPEVVGVRLFETRYRVVASAAYLAEAGHPSVPTQLTGLDCLRFTLPEFRSRWLFRRRGEEAVDEVPVSGALLFSNALALREAALAGLGPALLADWLIGQDLATGDLLDLFPDHEAAATSFETGAWLLYPSRQHMPARVRATIDFLRASLAR